MISNKKSNSKEELIEYAIRYLDALTAHDFSRFPVTDDVRFTENTKQIKLGEGLWKTATAIKYRHAVADPLQGQVGVFCTLQEGGEYLSLFALRMKVRDNKIAEVETMISRYAGQDVAFKPKTLVTPVPILTEIVPISERIPRERMIEISDLYLEGLEKNNAELIPLHPDCNRLEKGWQP